MAYVSPEGGKTSPTILVDGPRGLESYEKVQGIGGTSEHQAHMLNALNAAGYDKYILVPSFSSDKDPGVQVPREIYRRLLPE